MTEPRLRVDWIRCVGYGLCGDYAPDLVELDEWRYPILLDTPLNGRLRDDAQRIVDCCPVKALRLERPSPRSARVTAIAEAEPSRAPGSIRRA